MVPTITELLGKDKAECLKMSTSRKNQRRKEKFNLEKCKLILEASQYAIPELQLLIMAMN